jgi:hypothetical protein
MSLTEWVGVPYIRTNPAETVYRFCQKYEYNPQSLTTGLHFSNVVFVTRLEHKLRIR